MPFLAHCIIFILLRDESKQNVSNGESSDPAQFSELLKISTKTQTAAVFQCEDNERKIGLKNYKSCELTV